MNEMYKATPDANLGRAEAEVEARIHALFGRCPDLAGFAVQDPAVLLDESAASDEESLLMVTDVGLSITASAEELDRVYNLIGTALSDVLSERPEAIELLRGRTFARVLH